MWENPTPYRGPVSDDRGYVYFYAPAHPMARSNGMVSLARHQAAVRAGRWLDKSEVVVFDDSTAAPEIITRQELLRGNNAERLGRSVSFYCERAGCSDERTESLSHYCRRLRHYCSPECSRLDNRKFEISRTGLLRLIWMISTVRLAEILNVSDKAVEKRCKLLGVAKPPRGYWAKYAQAEWTEIVAVLAAEGIN